MNQRSELLKEFQQDRNLFQVNEVTGCWYLKQPQYKRYVRSFMGATYNVRHYGTRCHRDLDCVQPFHQKQKGESMGLSYLAATPAFDSQWKKT